MKRVILLLLGFLAFQLVIAAYFHPIENPVGIGSDGYEYWHLSTNLLKTHQFAYTNASAYPLLWLETLPPTIAIPEIIPCTTRLPGYPLLLAAFRSIWDSPWIAIILNDLAYLGVCTYGFLLGDILIASLRARWFYNILLVFTPLYFTRFGIGSDLITGFFLTAFIYHMIKKDIFCSCLFAILAVFTRANMLSFVILLALLTSIRKSILIVCMIAILLGAWMWRNHTLTGQWNFSTQDGFVLHKVHLVYDRYDNDETKTILFTKYLSAGHSFNQTEALVNTDLKTAVINHYSQQPIVFVKQWVERLRTLFMFSYFDISDVTKLSVKSFKERLDFVNSSSLNSNGVLFQISRVYKIILGVGFMSFILFLIFKKECFSRDIRNVYITTLVAILLTALYTGAAGDRMRLPFNAPLLIYVVLFLHSLKVSLKKS